MIAGSTQLHAIGHGRRKFLIRVLGTALFGGVMLSLPVPAAAQQVNNLNISPKRVVFAGAATASAVYIFNRGEEAVTYRVELVDRVMLPSGEIRSKDELIDNPAGVELAGRLKSSASMIQFTPRRVTLQPGQSQAIRLRLLRPAVLPDGEYRTTLTVSAVPPDDAGITADQAFGANDGKLSIKAIARFEVSIPLIVRQGQLAGLVRIDNARASGQKLELELARSGSRSVYGDLEVRENDANGKIVGLIRGVGVYEETDRRALEVSLNRIVSPGEALYLSFREDAAPEATAVVVERIVAK
ncbi:MAG: molecular chaperone [Novosphingobium sp.]|jgi:P pilus assembly chaperone PapD|uniref:fimbrial biogenesis chaperone n=1 Tax=Novosphingobium sp. TaxID=1874826 RepID=UPI00391CF838